MLGLTTAQLVTAGLAIASILVAAVVGPLLKRHLFDPTMFLRAEIRTFPTKTKAAMVTKFEELIKALPHEDQRTFWGMGREGGYTSIRLRNVGKKKLLNVTVTATGLAGVGGSYQFNDDRTLGEVKEGAPIPVGDMPPDHEKVLHIWTHSDLSDHQFGTVKRMFRMSADELHSTRKRFPSLRYQSSKLWNRFFIVWNCVWVVFMVYVFGRYVF